LVGQKAFRVAARTGLALFLRQKLDKVQNLQLPVQWKFADFFAPVFQ
jgi:hypothetical protein